MKYLLWTLTIFFLFMPTVYAENGIVTTAGGVNVRENPTTEAKIITAIPKNTNFYIVNTNSATGNGCDNPWFYVYYSSSYGYVCSTYIKIVEDNTTTSTTYDRPWTTPKKAIVGGAKFISGSYISRKQFTSYLKKFNVNPEANHPVYNHQYMANLRAPASEAYTSYTSLRDNNLLNNPYNFVIPVFLNMPETTYDSNIKNVDLKTADIQDEAFENSIVTFPDTYKPYLRYLYTIHPNWTFTPLHTGLDFDASVIAEKPVCSIEISSGQCETNPYTVTEKGWCIATDAATKFFLDPRNFLNEIYIFMFENLGYNSIYTEEIVQKILDGTFMSGLSLIDNQTYASIFVEAGQIADVSPLYLASLAIQEVGRNGSMATTGNQFDYEGYTYYNLYNFFNIGAYSSASSPVKAGLVYANGGAGVNNGANLDSERIKLLNILQVGYIDSYIKGYSVGTTVGNIKSKVGNQANVNIYDQNGIERDDNAFIATGFKVKITNESKETSFTYMLKGDINGDGEINSADLLKLRQHLLGINSLNGVYLKGANVTDDNEVNSADLLKIRQYLLGMATINQ